jgi:hypothetical protein
MATMPELKGEYDVLMATHARLLHERELLQAAAADGPSPQDHAHRTRLYINALDSYLIRLRARRQELRLKKSSAETPAGPHRK